MPKQRAPLTRAKRPTHSNRLLNELPRSDRQRMLGDCERVELAVGETLAERGKSIGYAYFPIESSISLVAEMGGGSGLEVAVVGNEGMLGVPLVLGIGVWPIRAVVQVGGAALRISAARFRRVLADGSPVRLGLHRYLLVRMIQFWQAAGCTRFHVVEQRLARKLLSTADRAHSESFHMTHELLAGNLGVRRVGVTKAATSLQDQDLISYSRGHITLRDRGGLEAAACSCYQTDKDTYARMMVR